MKEPVSVKPDPRTTRCRPSRARVFPVEFELLSPTEKHEERMKARSLFGMLLVALFAMPVWAGTPGPLPEPGVLELLAIAAVAGVAIGIRNRRK
jgi:hypothetical protein